MPIDIPGYKEVEIDSTIFLVPEYLVDDVKQLDMTQKSREKVGAETDTSSAPMRTGIEPRDKLAEGLIRACPDPRLSMREWLDLHAEVLALQNQYGISYKDAAHRLYMSEVAQFKALDRGRRAISSIRQRIDKLLDNEILPAMKEIQRLTNKDENLGSGEGGDNVDINMDAT